MHTLAGKDHWSMGVNEWGGRTERNEWEHVSHFSNRIDTFSRAILLKRHILSGRTTRYMTRMNWNIIQTPKHTETFYLCSSARLDKWSRQSSAVNIHKCTDITCMFQLDATLLCDINKSTLTHTATPSPDNWENEKEGNEIIENSQFGFPAFLLDSTEECTQTNTLTIYHTPLRPFAALQFFTRFFAARRAKYCGGKKSKLLLFTRTFDLCVGNNELLWMKSDVA